MPTRAELADALKMSEERLSELLRGALEPLSLETPIGKEGESRLANLIPAPDTHNPVVEATRGVLRDELMAALNELTPRENVIMLRYGMDGDEPRTLEEVGRALEVTRQRVRQIEASALTSCANAGAPVRCANSSANADYREISRAADANRQPFAFRTASDLRQFSLSRGVGAGDEGILLCFSLRPLGLCVSLWL